LPLPPGEIEQKEYNCPVRVPTRATVRQSAGFLARRTGAVPPNADALAALAERQELDPANILTPKQRRLEREIGERSNVIGMDHSNILEFPAEERTAKFKGAILFA
jgi:hypothetical protein